jgi:16S rRNA C967 or C1407 C5-methylase (RsmB/RsmF family)
LNSTNTRRLRAKKKIKEIKQEKIERDRDDREKSDRQLARQTAVDPFGKFWRDWVESRRHLDALLADLPKNKKVAWAPRIQALLRIPTSLAAEVGIGIPTGEPWKLSQEELLNWKPAGLVFQALEAKPEVARNLALDTTVAPVTVAEAQIVGGRDDFPPEMIAAWEKDWGKKVTDRLAASLSIQPGVALRVRIKESREAVRKELEARKDSFSEISPVGIRFEGYKAVMAVESFARGAFEIQDEGSQLLAIALLEPKLVIPLLANTPGEVTPPFVGEIPKKGFAPITVIDACAGAGGKTLAIADLMGGRGRVFAYDIFASKIAALKRRIGKAQMTNAKAIQLEAGKEMETLAAFIGKADAVLVDAPCSGWGVLRRNPDAKWKENYAEIEKLPPLQSHLLEMYSQLVRPGGRLVYSLCTFRKDESEAVVKQFEATHPEFTPIGGGYLGPAQTDGFFIQIWEKRGDAKGDQP